MRKMAEGIFRQYGTTLDLTVEGNRQQVRAFFQPVRSKSWQYLEGDYSPLGEIPRGQYVYIGPVEPAAEAGDTLTVDGKEYVLTSQRLQGMEDLEGFRYLESFVFDNISGYNIFGNIVENIS